MRARALLGLGIFSLALGAVGVARAEERGSGFEAGLRLGYGVPLGKATGDAGDDLDQLISGQMPLWLDLGYRAMPELFVGVYAQYGFGFVGDMIETTCDANGIDCSTSVVRIGAQLHYHPAPRASVDPWLGLGFGYEWLDASLSGPGAEVSITPHGFELLNLQLGLDVPVARNFYLGPMLSFSLGQYDTIGLDCSGASDCGMITGFDGDIPDKAIHEWFVIGVRAAYAP